MVQSIADNMWLEIVRRKTYFANVLKMPRSKLTRTVIYLLFNLIQIN